MPYFHYFSSQPGPNGKPYNFAFEHEAKTLDALGESLAEAGHLVVDRLSSTDDGHGGRRITRRERMLLGESTIASIFHETGRLWEPDAMPVKAVA